MNYLLLDQEGKWDVFETSCEGTWSHIQPSGKAIHTGETKKACQPRVRYGKKPEECFRELSPFESTDFASFTRSNVTLACVSVCLLVSHLLG